MQKLFASIATLIALTLLTSACGVEVNESASRNEQLLSEVISRLDRSSDLRNAGLMLEELLEKDGENPAVHVEHARFIMKTSSATRSIGDSARLAWPPKIMDHTKAALDRALKLDPDRADTLVLYGYVAMQRGEFEQALKMLRHAEEIGTNNTWLYVNWADTLMEIAHDRKDPEAEAKAMVYFEKAMEHKPPNAQTNNSAADSLVAYAIRNNDLVEAERIYIKLLKFTGNPARSHHSYAGFLLRYKGDAEAAFEHAKLAHDGRYSVRKSREIMARALCLQASQLMVETGDPTKAQPLFEQAGTLYPDLTDFAFDATWVPVQRVMLQGMSQYGLDIFANEDNRQISIIHMAVMRNNIEMVKEIIELGGNPNQPNEDNGTPLHAALFHSGPEMLELLLEHNADPTVKYRDGRTPLEIVTTSRGPYRDRNIAALTTAIEKHTN